MYSRNIVDVYFEILFTQKRLLCTTNPKRTRNIFKCFFFETSFLESDSIISCFFEPKKITLMDEPYAIALIIVK